MHKELRRFCIVGGNAVSAFLSWRLSATNACDVTLVWKSNYQQVAQYGISFKSAAFGNERFKPRSVVPSPEDAASSRAPAFDYVILCVKALPDVYSLADIIQSVVTPQHTCIIVNTTNTLGVEKQLEERFPTNVVLSLVSGANLIQLGSSEFEHIGSREIWVGPANLESKIPSTIQRDMSEALAMTLTTGHVDCKVSDNIRQQQYERMIGPIAFHPLSVLFETSDLTELLSKPGVRDLVTDVIEELLRLARANQCSFPTNLLQKTIETMTQPAQDPSTMYQDFTARRPMEVETYLGAPCQLAKEAGIAVPRIETLYTILRHINTTNKDRPVQPVGAPAVDSTTPVPAPARMAQNGPPPRPMNGGPMNGGPQQMPMRSAPNGMRMGPPPVRRGPPPMNGYRGPPPNGYPPRGPQPVARRNSFEENNLDDFSHVVMYDEVPDGDAAAAYGEPGSNAMAMRQRELMLREKELRLREQEMAMRNRGGPGPGPGPGPRRTSHSKHQAFIDDDDDDDDDYFDPMNGRGPAAPPIDADNFDMMSVTSRRTKRTTSQSQLRRGMFEGGGQMRGGPPGRPQVNRHRTSAQLMSDMPMLGSNILDNPMMGFASDRYGNVDRKAMADESRANSLTASRLQEMGGPGMGGPYPPPSRRTSRSPGNPLSPMGPGPMGPMGRPSGRPSPPHDPYMQAPRNGRPSPPGGVQAPVPRYPPGNMMHQHAVEQAGVSKPFPPKPTKSLTGSASASAGSGDSGSANIESDPSAHSSTSSFAPRAMMGIR
ncbi:hypothetical protein LTR70_002028 [Exophiala xenobiotica]|uniref:Uncharacterized protein n=1 Tax=Lithohypha guttulata TaxID=1690604 RepID=A0ABR0KA38_9EURO|nr:hypothetical protein LTR24_005045 [Lithohypha guttulata]KAK5326264.1 hypothetical protein LTR70_002028 [Exophiala xenobiotica]